jgi:hypothetical protein
VKIDITTDVIAEALSWHDQPGMWCLVAEHTPITLALRKLTGFESHYATYDGIYLAGVKVADLPDVALEFTRAFGYCRQGPLKKEVRETLKQLHKTSSDHATPIKFLVEKEPKLRPFKFELEV